MIELTYERKLLNFAHRLYAQLLTPFKNTAAVKDSF